MKQNNQQHYLNINDITEIDIETSNICNLKCPLCLRQHKEFKHAFVQKFIDFENVKIVLNKFKNLDTLSICGDASEPTLHPQLINFLDYLKENKPNIFIELYTNGSTHDVYYWKELNKHFNLNSSVIFTICGITQHTHSMYRVNSNLKNVIENALAFKNGNQYKNDYMKYIRFEYNKHESMKDIICILSMFSSYEVINTDPIQERFQFNDAYIKNNNICSDKIFQLRYKQQLIKLHAKDYKRYCHNYMRKLLKMDNECNLYPCVMFRLYKPKFKFIVDNKLDYSLILNKQLPFCYECTKEMVDFFQYNNRTQVFIC